MEKEYVSPETVVPAIVGTACVVAILMGVAIVSIIRVL